MFDFRMGVNNAPPNPYIQEGGGYEENLDDVNFNGIHDGYGSVNRPGLGKNLQVAIGHDYAAKLTYRSGFDNVCRKDGGDGWC